MKSSWSKFKSYKQGYKAAKKGVKAAECPHQLTDEMKAVLLKRVRWLAGWEEGIFTFKKKRVHVDKNINRVGLQKVAFICPKPKNTEEENHKKKSKKKKHKKDT